MSADFTLAEKAMAVRLKAAMAAVFGARTVTDLYAWRRGRDRGATELVFGLVGPVHALDKALGRFAEGLPQRNHNLEIALARALGVSQRVTNERGHLFVSPQFSSGDTLSMGEFFEMLEGMVREALGDESVQITLLPAPGVPWSHGPTSYFSAKTQRMQAPRPFPFSVVQVEVDEHGERAMRPALRPCDIAPRATEAPLVPGGWIAEKHPLMLTHCTVQEKLFREGTEKAILDCGGLLFPSMALATSPATLFGPIVMVFDPRLVLQDFAPGRPRGAPPWTQTYNTDVWTDTQTTFDRLYGRQAFLELTGQRDYANYYEPPKLYATGPSEALLGTMGPTGSRPLKTWAQVAREASSRHRFWDVPKKDAWIRRFQEAGQIDPSSHAVRAVRYPYLETKARCVVGAPWVAAMVAPAPLRDRVEAFARRWGVAGPVHGMPWDTERQQAFEESGLSYEASAWVRSRYGHDVAAWVREALSAVYRG